MVEILENIDIIPLNILCKIITKYILVLNFSYLEMALMNKFEKIFDLGQVFRHIFRVYRKVYTNFLIYSKLLFR